MKLKLFSLLLIGVLFLGCDSSDDNSTNSGEFSENFGAAVDRDFIGQVVDMDGNPIASATILISGFSKQTDVNGIFIMDNAPVHERFAYIKATKVGYIDASRAMVPTTGKNMVKIMMRPFQSIQTVNSGTAAEVTLSSTTKIKLDGSYVDASGNAYSGTVSVTAFHLKPSDANLSSLMPGMLYAEDSNGKERVLETYGMLQVELRGSGGQKLQIASGHTAEIDVLIDASQMASAPSIIPMWHFDEENGYWKEEGTATKDGNYYKATVSHFSWWNCDAQFPTVSLTVKLVDANGNPLANVLVGLIRTGATYAVNGLTNTGGMVTGLVPANEVLTMNVSDNCGNIIYTTAIGPFSANTTLPDFTIPNGTVQSTLVQGTLLQCDANVVTMGYVVLHYGSQAYFSAVDANGVFSFNTLVCNTSSVNFSLEGYDYGNLQTTGLTNHTFTFPTTNIGSINACAAVSEYINYSIDGGPLVTLLTNVGGGIDGNYIFANASNGNDYINIGGMAITTGSYTTSQSFSLTIPPQFTISSSIPNTVIFNVTTIDPVGGYININFSGPYTDGAVNHTINGTAHVIRNN